MKSLFPVCLYGSYDISVSTNLKSYWSIAYDFPGASLKIYHITLKSLNYLYIKKS